VIGGTRVVDYMRGVARFMNLFSLELKGRGSENLRGARKPLWRVI